MAEQQGTNMFKFYDGMKNFSEFFQTNKFYKPISTEESLRIFSKTTTAGIEIYDAWLRGLHNLINENFMLFRKVVDEENADSECLLNATSQMCESVIDRIIEATKDTPFEGIQPNLQEIKKSTDFKKNGHMMKAFLQPGIDASIFIMKAFKNSINGMSNGTLNMMSQKKETT